VDLEKELTHVPSPDCQHTTIENVTDRSLRVKSYRLPNSSIVTAPAKKPAAPTAKRSEASRSEEIRRHSAVPTLVGGEGRKVFCLELADEFGVEVGVLGHGVGLTIIVSSVSEYLCHVAIRVLSVERSFSNFSICFEVSDPGKLGPRESANTSVKVT